MYSELSFGDWKCNFRYVTIHTILPKKNNVKSWKWLYFLKFYSWSDYTNDSTCKVPYFKPSSTESRFWVGEWKYPKNFLCFPHKGKFYVLYYEYCSLLAVVIQKHVIIILKFKASKPKGHEMEQIVQFHFPFYGFLKVPTKINLSSV